MAAAGCELEVFREAAQCLLQERDTDLAWPSSK
jgi:hypothetical protein